MTTWDDKPNDYEHALAEIERLTDALKTCRELRQWDHNAAIEECARVVLKYDGPYEIVQAIRELKD